MIRSSVVTRTSPFVRGHALNLKPRGLSVSKGQFSRTAAVTSRRLQSPIPPQAESSRKIVTKSVYGDSAGPGLGRLRPSAGCAHGVADSQSLALTECQWAPLGGGGGRFFELLKCALPAGIGFPILERALPILDLARNGNWPGARARPGSQQRTLALIAAADLIRILDTRLSFYL